jgi:UPF0755 protein
MSDHRARPEEILAATDSERGLPKAIPHKHTRKPKRRRSHTRMAVVGVATIIAIVALTSVFLEHALQAAQASSGRTFTFVVRYGDTPDAVAARMESDGIIHDALIFSGVNLFKIDARLHGLASKLVPGTYTLKRDMSIDQIVSLLGEANPNLIKVIVKPGWRAEQIAALLKSIGFNGHAFLRAVRHPSMKLPFRTGLKPHHSLEGFLFPDTYEVDPAFTGKQLVRMMVAQFTHEFTPAMRRKAHKLHRSVYSTVKMASIVMREDGIVSQMPQISSTYYNRLALPRGANGGVGKLLQSDPTVSYALGNRTNWWPLIPGNRSTIISRFNTFTHYGLPPTPIAEPDLAALKAALRPAHTQYYYFATKPGENSPRLYFARTYGQFCVITGC